MPERQFRPRQLQIRASSIHHSPDAGDEISGEQSTDAGDANLVITDAGLFNPHNIDSGDADLDG